MAVPYTFGTATAAIPLSNLDSNFATTITLGNTAIQLGNTVTTLNNMTLANATVSSLSTPISPAQGGTGLATLTANNVMLGNGTNNVAFVAPGTSGNVLSSNGTTWLSQAASAGTSIVNGTSNVSIATSGGAVTVATNGTVAVTINTSQNVGVGTTSPAYKMDVNGDANVLADSSYFIGANADRYIKYRSSANDILYSGYAGLFYQQSAASSYHAWFTGNNERMRIDSSGNVLVGTTSKFGDAVLSVLSTSPNQMVYLRTSHASVPGGIFINYSASAPNNTGSEFLFCNDTSQTRMNVRSNGGIANYSGNNVNLSDRREKTNFAPSKPYLDVICAIPVQTFNYIDQNTEQDPGLTLGVVAQDVQAVAPELVSESDWSTEKDGSKMRLSIYQTDLQYALMKALQELKAEFDAYKAAHP